MYNSGTNTGKAGYYVSKLLFPIVNVPTNIAIKTLHSAVGMAEFGAKALSGFKDLRPEEQDKALMYFKEGLPGLALGVIALSNKDTKIDKNHNFYFCGVKVPKILEHIPWILSTRLYAEAKMAYGKKNPHDTFVEKTVKGLAAAYIDFEQSIPFLNSELIGGKDIKAIETYLETMVTSFIPQGLADITKFTDPRTGKVDWEKFFKGATKTYKPRNIKERFETRIPGMSKKVPVKKIR
jgi:hypothetical protein